MKSCGRLFSWSFLIFFLFFAQPASAQDHGFKVFLAGDAGEDDTTGETLKNLGIELIQYPNSAVVFLGDNCYKSDLWGIIPYGYKGFDGSKLTQRKVRSQLNILTNYKGYVFFVPGNHDWWNLTKLDKGLPALKKEESFIEANLSKNPTIANPGNTFLPRDGSPGPVCIDLDSGRLKLVLIDTYRLIITAFKKKEKDDFPIERIFYRQLDSVVKDAKARHQKLMVAGHHTLYAKGPNSKPLRNPYIFGRIKASNSSFPASSRMSGRIRHILKQYPGSYYVCGHVHSLQYFMPADSVHYIVSGAGSKISYVSPKTAGNNIPGPGEEYLLWNVKGFFEVDFISPTEKIWLHYDNGSKLCIIQ
jgi:UDP-2,3-diacylglucosamine pyrophosphatase LpxH